MRTFLCFFFLVFGCADSREQREVEPIEVPADPSEWGIEVGVRTVDFEGQRFEVWYPATSQSSEMSSDRIDFSDFVPASFEAHLNIEDPLPSVSTESVRDAPIRLTETPVPVLLFSHGFGGMRVQSFGLTSHLASRGYVVVAPDHPGRMLGDVLPCLISPPLEGCDLSGFGNDPAIDDLDAAHDWVEWAATQSDWKTLIDPDRVGLFGHSAGAGSTTELGQDDDRYSALVPMAGGGAVSRDVPVLRIDASCDGFVPSADETVLDELTDGQFIQIQGGGHMAFTDLCALGLGTLADEVVAPREDANTAILPQLRGLAVDGCPTEPPRVEAQECAEQFLSLDISDRILRYHLTRFFDVVLKAAPESAEQIRFQDIKIWTK